jgi:hypothetical protein
MTDVTLAGRVDTYRALRAQAEAASVLPLLRLNAAADAAVVAEMPHGRRPSA